MCEFVRLRGYRLQGEAVHTTILLYSTVYEKCRSRLYTAAHEDGALTLSQSHPSTFCREDNASEPAILSQQYICRF